MQEMWVLSPGEGNDNPLQYSCLGNPMDGGVCWATVHGVSKSQTQLSDFTLTFHFQMTLVVKKLPANAGDIRDVGLISGLGRSPGEGNDNPLQYSCLENPMNRGFWRATVHRVAKSRTRLKHLACLHIYFNVSWSTQAVSLQIKVIKIDLNTYAK